MNNKMSLWQIGLIVFIVGLLTNTVFMSVGIGGLLRELSRLSVFVGLGIFVIGLVRRK